MMADLVWSKNRWLCSLFVLFVSSWFILLLGTLSIIPSIAQETEFPAMTNRDLILRTGPGDTYLPTGSLPKDIGVMILERNRIGNWLHVAAPATSGEDITGWVMNGHLDLREGVRFSEVPINTDLPDADLEQVEDENLQRLYSVPIIPLLDAEIVIGLRVVYERGQQAGLNRDNITKVGDSNSARPIYLNPLAIDDYDLGPYDFLQPLVDRIAPSLEEYSVAARVGLNAFSIFDPFWASQTFCDPRESPLLCEFRLRQPAIAVIMFGPNDLSVLNSTEYETQMRQLIQKTLDAGVIPLLSTFTYSPTEADWSQAVRFNLILLDIAEDMNIPLVNLWSAERTLPGYGIGSDPLHMTESGDKMNFDGHESFWGISLQNLVVLCALDELYRAVIIDN
jgi:hypothetical protein